MTCCAVCTCVWTSLALPSWEWSSVSERRCWWKPSHKQLVTGTLHQHAIVTALLCPNTACAFPTQLLIQSFAHQPKRRPFDVSLLFPGRQLDKIKAEAQEKGDLGLVAESSRSNQRMMFKPASLTVGGVFKKLKEIGSMSGNSVSHRITFSLEENRFRDNIVFSLFASQYRTQWEKRSVMLMWLCTEQEMIGLPTSEGRG